MKILPVLPILNGLFLLSSLINCSSRQLSKTIEQARPTALSQGIVSPEQMNQFTQAIEKKKIVGLGEAHHYSDGVNQVRIELVKHMIQNLNFRAIFIETQEAAVNNLRGYINSSCSPMRYVHFGQIFEGWISQPHRDFFQWLCRYNQKNPKNKIVLFGFDINSSSASANKFLRQTFNQLHKKRRLSTAIYRQINKNIPFCLVGNSTFNRPLQFEKTRAKERERFTKIYKTQFTIDKKYDGESCQLAVVVMEKALSRLKDSLPALQFHQARVQLNSLKHENEMLFFQATSKKRFDTRAVQARDRGMAYSIALAKKALPPEAKIIIWAATAHLNKNTTKETRIARPPSPYIGHKMMGHHLNEIFSQNYFVLHISSPRLLMSCSKKYSYCKSEEPQAYPVGETFWEKIYDRAHGTKTAFMSTNSNFFANEYYAYRQSVGLYEASDIADHVDAVYFIPQSKARQTLPDAPQFQ